MGSMDGTPRAVPKTQEELDEHVSDDGAVGIGASPAPPV